MDFSPFPPPLTRRRRGGERNSLLGIADEYLSPVDEAIAVSQEQRGFVPGFNWEDNMAEIDRALESGLISPEEALEVRNELESAHNAAEAEDIVAAEALKHPNAA